ncbi:MAG: mechanosensitive ion channel family protein [Micavibrio sp.]
MEFSLSSLPHELLTSVIFIAFLLALRTLLIRMVRRKADIMTKEQRRWINRIKNSIIVVMLICLTMIWAPQLQTFALSLTAFTVALVIATKEMILCLTGSLFRVSTQPYKIGDWVSIDGITGEVMDINAFTTRLEEIDVAGKSFAFTGKSIFLPNSKLFTAIVENQSFIKSFVFQDFSVAVQSNGLNPVELAATLKEVTEKHTAASKEDASKFARRVSRKAGIDIPEAEPSFGFRTTELGHYVFTGRIFVPTRAAAEIATLISQEFLANVHEIKKDLKESESVA